jgi:hypothetical protein
MNPISDRPKVTVSKMVSVNTMTNVDLNKTNVLLVDRTSLPGVSVIDVTDATAWIYRFRLRRSAASGVESLTEMLHLRSAL